MILNMTEVTKTITRFEVLDGPRFDKKENTLEW